MIVYTDLCRSDHPQNGLEEMMRQRLPGRAEYLHGLDDLKKRLRTSIYNIDMMVIHVGSASPIPELLEYQNDLKVGARPQIPNYFFVLTQKRNQKRSRLSPLRTKNYA